ncbi:hypothetical protein BHE97_07280 [Aeromicrobium sp. PE09-221]|uniref:hypothetical protein n=1 Tax=Aeromicrobium sp. PE09-221 TaxID=1898043 RepID=UPI000B3E67F2|nr:hypothetical protein [Aeromicrobium sp. PE09-221]OUZ10551.1 hypothetical protein BHE97_07280 [Aeromicrobium sp. PE09-221]
MRWIRTLTAVAGLGAVVALAGAAQAATSYTPAGGPQVSFEGSGIDFTAVQAGQTLSCDQFDLVGTMLNPGVSRPYGANSKELGDIVTNGCSNPIAGTVTVEPIGHWTMAVTGDPTGTVWPGELGDVQVKTTVAGCTFHVTGEIEGTFDTATQKLEPTASALVIADVPSGFLCPLLGVGQGQDIEVEGSWTNTSAPVTLSTP